MNNKEFEIVDVKKVTMSLVKIKSNKDGEYYIMNDGVDVDSVLGDKTLTSTEKNEIVKELGNGPGNILSIAATSNDEFACSLGNLFINYMEALDDDEERKEFKKELLLLVKETLDEY